MSGLAPASMPGPGQSIEHLKVDMLEAIDPEDRELIWQPMVDSVSRIQAAGGSRRMVDLLETQLRRLLRCLYERQLRRGAPLPQLDIQLTDWGDITTR